MADNVTIDPGTTTPIASDDIGGVQFQRMKVAAGANGSHTGDVEGRTVDGGAGAALFVDPRPRTGHQIQDSSGLTTASTNYTLGDVVGAGWTFTSMARAAGQGGRITGVSALDDGDVLAGLDLFFASGSITFGTDNVAPSVSDADAAKILGVVGLSFVDLGGSRFASAPGLSVPYICDATSLFVYARTLDGNNFFAAADDVHLRLFYELD